MISKHTILVFVLGSIGVGGCSSHPLIDDVTRKNTVAIVQAIRCEARKGLIEAYPLAHKKEVALELGYDFTFDITETDMAKGGLLTVTNVVANGNVAFNFKGGVDKKRRSERYFRVKETLKTLREDVNLIGSDKDCGDRANLLYPIAGSVGADEFVRTYLSLSSVTAVETFPEKKGVFLDTLTFTTDVSAGMAPDLSLNTPAGGVRLTKVKFDDAGVQRKDEHKVTMAISEATVVTGKKRGRSPQYKTMFVPIPGTSSVDDALNSIRERDNLERIYRERIPLP